jgi:hypothetical protein
VQSQLAWWNATFWNRTVRAEYFLPDGPRYGQVLIEGLGFDVTHGRLAIPGSYGFVAQSTHEIRFGLRGHRVASRGGVALVSVPVAAPLRWAMEGVDAAGHAGAKGAVLHIYGSAGSVIPVTLTLAQPGEGTRQLREVMRIGSTGSVVRPLSGLRGAWITRVDVPGSA